MFLSPLQFSENVVLKSVHAAAGVLSYQQISQITFEAVLQVVLICFAGFCAARSGLLNTNGQKVISSLNVDLFTPCLVFTKLAPSLSLEKMVDVLIIPIFFAVSTGISYLSALFMGYILNLNDPETDFVTAMAVFGNSNSLPVSLTLALAYSLPNLYWDQLENDDDDQVASRGMLYLLIFQQLGQILRWSWGFNTLLRRRTPQELTTYDTYKANDEESTINEASALLTAQLNSTNYIVTTEQEVDDTDSSDYKVGATWHSTLSKPIKVFLQFMNPPLYAMLISILVASVPALRNFFFGDQTSFVGSTVTESIKQLASVSIPLILIVLGSNLYPSTDIPPSSKHYKKIVIGSLLSRMIIPSIFLLPLIALSVRYLKISILDDPIFLLVAFILTASPPAIQLSQITQLNGIYQKEMSGVLFWGYVILTLPTTILIVVMSLKVMDWANY